MATASKKNPAPAPAPRKASESAKAVDPSPSPQEPWIWRGFDATYRFLASLKLAVFCILSLAAVLAGATIFESFTTPAASRLYIYRNPLFAILLTFLGTNVFCAATIRYPWKKRQIGFLVTHIGLLVILAGAFVSLKGSDEGQLGMAEGSTSSEIERDHPRIKIQKVKAADFRDYDLQMVSLEKDDAGIPRSGKKLVVLAGSKKKLFVRAFGADGEVVVDTDSAALARTSPDFAEFLKRLPDFWPPHELSRAEKEGINSEVQALARYSGIEVVKGYALPFAPGTFSWDSPEVARLVKTPDYQRKLMILRASLAASLFTMVALVMAASLGRMRLPRLVAVPLFGGVGALCACLSIYNLVTPSAPRRDVVSDKSDPFTFVVRDYLASANPFQKKTIAEPDEKGTRLARLALLAQPPNAKAAMDSFGGDGWFEVSSDSFGRQSRDARQALVSFQEVGGARVDEMISDFLNPPKNPMTDRTARFFYADRSGKPRSFDWVVSDELLGKSITLPDADLTVKLETLQDASLMNPGLPKAAELKQALGEKVAHIAAFEVGRVGAAGSKYFAVASLPTPENAAGGAAEKLVRISYFHPPAIDRNAGMAGRLGVMEVLATDDGRYFYRAFGRTGLRGAGPIQVGKPVKIFGGDKMPMQISLELAEVMDKGTLREVYPALKLPFEERDKAIPAVEGELTIDGETKKVSLLSSVPIRGQKWGDILRFPGGYYRASFDLDRTSVPFRLSLTKFTPGMDPGSASPATYTSYVELDDPEMGLNKEPRVITMNEPLTHRGWTFYQSSFTRTANPRTGHEDGLYLSIFQVHYDPAWTIVYSGCGLVVLGIFLQFYMRAGVFTDGGKLEKARAEARARKKSGLAPLAPPAATADEPLENL